MILSGFLNFFKETKEMPNLFRFQHMLNSMTYSLIALLGFWPWPNGSYSLNGRDLTYQEFWLTGMAPSFLAFSLLMVAVCSACVNRHWLGRLGVFMYWASVIAFLTFHSIVSAVIGSLLIAIWGYYVFGNTKVNMYFAKNCA